MLLVAGLYEGNLPVIGEFPAQRVSNVENVSISWRHHVLRENIAKIVNNKFEENMSNFSISTVPADALAPFGARASAGTVMVWVPFINRSGT